MSVEKEIGLILRQARESIGISLDDLQEKTNIQRSFLTAIEDGDFNKLPSPFYVRTYLRNYANSVKIEPHHILRHYRRAEQAERGLTGVHKVVSQQTTLTEQLGLNTSMKTDRYSNTSAPGNTMKDKQTQRIARTTSSTALTIAKKTSMATKSPSQSQQTSPALNKRKSRTDLTNTNPSVLSQTVTSNLENSGEATSRLDKYSQTKSHTYQSLSRTRTHKELSSTTPPKKTNSTNSVLEVTQSVSQIPSLSRSTALRRGSRKSLTANPLSKRSTQLIIALVVICVPLLWVVFSFFSDDSEDSNTNTQENQIQQNDSVKPNPSANTLTTPSQITLKESVGNTNHYEVSGLDNVKVNFQATGESWIQVRKQREIQKSGFLDEAILQPGNSDIYDLDFAKTKEIWITLAIPQSVKVSINGQVLKSSKTIHIVQK